MANSMDQEAFEAGRTAGWRHAAYGGELHNAPSVPGTAGPDSVDAWLTGWNQGIEDFLAEETERI